MDFFLVIIVIFILINKVLVILIDNILNKVFKILKYLYNFYFCRSFYIYFIFTYSIIFNNMNIYYNVCILI